MPFAIGGRPAFLLNRPDYVEQVLVTHASAFAKGPANTRSKRLLGNGLLTAEGSCHANRRRLIQPAFARRRLDDVADVIVARTDRLAAGWTDGARIDLVAAMGALTFGIVGEAVIGVPVDRFYEIVRSAVQEATASLDALVSLVAPLRRITSQRKQLLEVVDCLLAEHRRASSTSSLLSVLVSASAEPLEDEQLRDDLLTLLLAGHDTISNALCWTWLLLALYPDVERVLVNEVQQVLDGRPPSVGNVAALTYTRSVLTESLRLYPPAWVLARRALEDHQFDEGVVRKGSIVLVSPYLLHRDERYFANSMSFQPDRWLGSGAERPRLAFFPFGAGPRSCIGESFAWLEGVLILATLAQRFSVMPDQPFPGIDPRITMRAKGGVWARVAHR